MPAPSDLVHETSTSTGTGNFTLANVNGKRSFNTAFGTGGTDLFDYYISHNAAAEWERGTGHLSAADTLVRDTVLASSNGGAAVNFAAGTKDVVNDIPAAKQYYRGDVPQGRLTLTTVTPVLTATASGQTTIYYTPYLGRRVPLYDGTGIVTHDVGGELSQATTDNTKSPAAVANSSNYDMFVWLDSGTYRCTRGPAWTSDTGRGTGAGTTELERVNGLLVNKVAITNGPGAQRGTYVGTVRSNGSAQIDWILPTTASSGGTAAVLNVWNMYNRVTAAALILNSKDSWTYTTATWRAVDAGTGMRCNFVLGFVEDAVEATFSGIGVHTGGVAVAGIGVNVTNNFSGSTGFAGTAAGNVPIIAHFRGVTGLTLGSNFLSAVEYTTGSTATFYGDIGAPTWAQNGFSVKVQM